MIYKCEKCGKEFRDRCEAEEHESMCRIKASIKMIWIDYATTSYAQIAIKDIKCEYSNGIYYLNDYVTGEEKQFSEEKFKFNSITRPTGIISNLHGKEVVCNYVFIRGSDDAFAEENAIRMLLNEHLEINKKDIGIIRKKLEQLEEISSGIENNTLLIRRKYE